MSREQEQHGVSGLGFADNCEVLPGQWPATLDEGPVSAWWPFLDRRAVFAMRDVQSPEDAVHLYVAASIWALECRRGR